VINLGLRPQQIWRHDIKHNGTELNDGRHSDSQHNEFQLNHLASHHFAQSVSYWIVTSNVVMLGAIRQNAIMLSVVAPKN
jgi:hypothetical protein